MTKLLTGMRIVTMATNLPGPLAAARLSALGAAIVKVEPPAGDGLATVDADWYRELAVGQDVRVIDLKSKTGRHAFLELLADADLLLTASRPAALDRLGLSWLELSAKFPRLCQVAIVGQTGEQADLPGHDLTYLAVTGLLQNAAMPLCPYADFFGAERAVSETCAALLGRQLHGQTSYREVSLADAADHLAEPLRRGLTLPSGLLGGGMPGYGLYPAREGFIATACIEPHFLRRLKDELGIDGSRISFEQAFLRRNAAEWQEWALARDIPLVRVVTEPENQTASNPA
jgi:alpha-methylacyl-CoA racemase